MCRKWSSTQYPKKKGSAQQSVRVCILRGFLEIDGPAPGTARRSDFPAEWLRTNNHAAERTPAVEMAGRGNRGNVQTRPFPDSPHPWESRTKRGIPTFPPRRRRRTAFTPKSETRQNRGVLQILAQNPKNKREILADDKLQPIFGGKKMDMFQMTKAVNKHLK